MDVVTGPGLLDVAGARLEEEAENKKAEASGEPGEGVRGKL
jgi:hypothetical protein